MFQFEQSFRLNELIFQKFLSHSIDTSLNSIFKTYDCNTLQDVVNHYKKYSGFSGIFADESDE
jgi:hypothetical protein